MNWKNISVVRWKWLWAFFLFICRVRLRFRWHMLGVFFAFGCIISGGPCVHKHKIVIRSINIMFLCWLCDVLTLFSIHRLLLTVYSKIERLWCRATTKYPHNPKLSKIVIIMLSWLSLNDEKYYRIWQLSQNLGNENFLWPRTMK